MELGTVIANATMDAAARIVNIRGIENCDAVRLTECLRQVLREDAMGILDTLKDASHMGEAMCRMILGTECTAAALKAVDLYQS